MPHDRSPMTDDELAAELTARVESSSTFIGGALSEDRANNISTYFRYGYVGDDIARDEDRSTVVDSTAADTVDWLLAQLLRTFTGGERAVSFIPNGPDDIDDAEREERIVEYVLRVQNRGYLLLHSWLWDGLVCDVGYVKAFWEDQAVREFEEYTGQTEADIDAILADLDAEDTAEIDILRKIENVDRMVVDPVTFESDPDALEKAELATEISTLPDGNIQITRVTYDIKLGITRAKRGVRVVPVPGNNVLLPDGWTSLSLEDIPWIGHRDRRSVSSLVSEGFDEDMVENLPDHDETINHIEEQARHLEGELFQTHDAALTGAAARKTVIEVYARIDRDGDGYAELVKAVMANGQILRYSDGAVAVEEIEEIPIHAWSPYIVPHRHHGEGVVGRLSDVQLNNSSTQRALMDSMAFTSNPRMVVGTEGAGPDTVADALKFRPGGLIRAKNATAVVPLKLPSVVADTLPILDYWEGRKEERTGVTRYNQGLDADHLNKTATGVAMIQEAGLDKVQMVARNFAETGFSSLFQHIHALLRRHQDTDMEIEIGGGFIQANPREWGPRTNIRIGVGLGASSVEKKQANLERVIGKQAELMLNGSPLASPDGLYNALADWTQSLGLQDPSRYFVDPATIPPAPPEADEPTPEEQLAEAQVKAAGLSAVARLEDVRAKAESDARKDQLKAAELRLKREEMLLDDDRERDIAIAKILADLEKVGMNAEAVALRQLLTPPASLAVVGD